MSLGRLYCRLDTILLGEVITLFRQQMFKHFELDCTAYISFPQLAFDCCLKTFSEPIELKHDPDMVLMIEQKCAWWCFFYWGKTCQNTKF